MEWVTLSRQFNPAEAELLRCRLEAAGFTVLLKNMDAALAVEGYSLLTGGILVQVPAVEAEEARGLLAADADAGDAAESDAPAAS